MTLFVKSGIGNRVMRKRGGQWGGHGEVYAADGYLVNVHIILVSLFVVDILLH